MGRTSKKIKVLWFFLPFVFSFQKAIAAPPLRIVGSSAVFPFAATVAEHFSYKTHEPIPLIEAIGTGAGVKLFCSSLEGPDGAVTSRPLTEKEKERCQKNGVLFKEFKIGRDGLVLIQSHQGIPFTLSLADLNKALAEKISEDGKCIMNPYETWNEVQPNFPTLPIRVLGPAPTSGTYDVLVEKILGTCGPHLRRDGTYVEAPANENLIVQKVLNTYPTVGIVTFSFYDQNRHRLHAFPIDGVTPTFRSIQEGKYILSRHLFLYLKTNNLKQSPARVSYAVEFTSEAAIGENGYLNEKGLIPLSPEEQKTMHNRALGLHERDAQ